MKLASQRTADLCHSDDGSQKEQGLERFVTGMSDRLIERAI